MIPISWREMQCPQTNIKEFRKVARVQPEYLEAWETLKVCYTTNKRLLLSSGLPTLFLWVTCGSWATSHIGSLSVFVNGFTSARFSLCWIEPREPRLMKLGFIPNKWSLSLPKVHGPATGMFKIILIYFIELRQVRILQLRLLRFYRIKKSFIFAPREETFLFQTLDPGLYR